MAGSDANQKLDMGYILKFSSAYDLKQAGAPKRIMAYVRSKDIMTSRLGKLYIQRLSNLAAGHEPDKLSCIFCRTEAAKDGVLCDSCMEKYSKGSLTIKKKEEPAPAPEVKAEPAPVEKQPAVTDSAAATLKTGKKIAGKAFKSFVGKVDVLAGGKGDAELRVRDLFKDVLKRHTSEEAERIFICGTAATTPARKDISSEWPAPWLYSRVALWLFAAFFILEFAWDFSYNLNLLPAMMFIGSCIVPFAIMVFFFETNVPRNISIFRTVQIFMVGGCMSLLCTLILFEAVPVGDLNFIGAILVGIIEETGKMLIVAWFIKRIQNCTYILNGMLLGSAVGAGFAAFESAGYAFRWLGLDGYEAMVGVINRRALLSPGGHVAWAAITGAAIMIALNGQKFEWKILKDSRFLKLYAIPVILHAVWDMPIKLPFIHGVLILIVWIVLLVLIHNGLKEASS